MALGYDPQNFPGLTGAIPSFLTTDANPDLAVLKGVFFQSQKAVGNADYFANQILSGRSKMDDFTETREPNVWQAYYNLYTKDKGAYDKAKSAGMASNTPINTTTTGTGMMNMPSWVKPVIIVALVVAAVYFIYRAMKRKK